MKRNTIELEQQGPDLGKLVKQLPLIMKKKAISEALVKAGRPVVHAARRLAPVGDPKHKPELPALRDSIDMVVRKYQHGAFGVGIIGAKYPEAAHAHLVEYGHKNADGSRARARKFLTPAVKVTRQQQNDAITQVLLKYIDKTERKASN